MAHTPYYNHPMVDLPEGDPRKMTPERATELAASEAARQQRIVDDPTDTRPPNVYGIDTSIAQNVGATSPEASATGMGFQAWMESQGLWQEYLQGEHPMAYDQWAQRPAEFSGQGLYVDDSDVEGAGGAGGGGGGGGDDVDIRKNLRDDFYMALRGVGIPDAMLDSLWTEMEGQLTNDPSMTAQRLLLGMYESDAFADRFPAIVAMKAGGAAPRNVPTPGQYIQFEKAVSKELKRVGFIEPNFNNLITQLYTNSVGLDEVTERLDMAQKVMWEMPQAVRDKLADWFGDASATSISMKTFLDPADDWARVQDDISTAQTGGWGQMVAGLGDWNEALAKRVADTGLSQRDQWLRFTELKAQEMLFQENIGETRDLDYATEGVEAAFDLDSDLVETIERRATGRSARFSGGGGAMLSGTTTGFGAANA